MTIRLVLGDQLNAGHSWYSSSDSDVLYVMMEIKPESEYVTHHIQKVVGIFAAMRGFATHLESEGHQVRYFHIHDTDNEHSFYQNVANLCEEYDVSKVEYQEPDEWRLDELLKKEFARINAEIVTVSTEHFYTTRLELQDMFLGKKQYLMERFYRQMRVKHNVLMDGNEPVSGKWNYDQENRKKLPKNHPLVEPLAQTHDVSDILDQIKSAGITTIGSIDGEHFGWPISRSEALDTLDYFMEYLLPQFGKYQDAMTTRDWSLFHSRLSFSLNLKVLSPKQVVDRVERTWRSDPDKYSIAQVEGFIRQILGWREYMRGIYWAHMPEYAGLNHFDHTRPLPRWYWTGETKMKCLSHAISQSLEYAYAHHIQRLMVTGNFALLAGVDPDELDQWYLGIYIDAFEWVEITNTRGMSQYADGGIVGTKPYISSASYVHKMSDYCAQCHYDHKQKVSENACPFNSLYWHFLDQNRDRLESNRRMTMMYRVWDKMGDQKGDILEQANGYLENIEEL